MLTPCSEISPLLRNWEANSYIFCNTASRSARSDPTAPAPRALATTDRHSQGNVTQKSGA